MSDYYPLGTAVYVWAHIRDRDYNPSDPNEIALTVTDPDGGDTEYEPDREGVGRYSYIVVPEAAGLWRFRFETADPTASFRDGFYIST